ncbi:hypothetical protein F53441_6480 [Fusarium austroafricanum]|uniref:SnoaL-like domain-containing protein n=1 Tax=Fusarium austroafricanum TaxID=2364996 RepID=A0A8H4KIE5_9HYPO|nr:hypothetical protein F53441_6480 [Fusarium austroafricanum]
MSSSTQSEVTPVVSTLTATASAYIDVFRTLDTKALSKILSHNYNHIFAPASANLPGPMDRDALIARIKLVGEVMSSFTVTVKQISPNPSMRQVLVWADSYTNFHKHLKDTDDDEEWTKKGEYIFLFTMDESGEKIVDVLEFVDSKVTEEIVSLVSRAMVKKKSLGDD